MKPDWDKLGEKYEDSKKVLIGDVDCTADSGKPLCEKYGVEGYPTLMYFNPPETEPNKYEGGRSLKELKKFIKTLGPACTVDSWENCSKKQKEALQPYLDMPAEELATSLADSTKQISDMQARDTEIVNPTICTCEVAVAQSVGSGLKCWRGQAAHDALMESLQAQYKESDEKLKALKDDLGPKVKLMKAATKKPVEAEATATETKATETSRRLRLNVARDQ